MDKVCGKGRLELAPAIAVSVGPRDFDLLGLDAEVAQHRAQPGRRKRPTVADLGPGRTLACIERRHEVGGMHCFALKYVPDVGQQSHAKFVVVTVLNGRRRLACLLRPFTTDRLGNSE